MKLRRLNLLLTGEEEPLFLSDRDKSIIKKCLEIINDIEDASLTLTNIGSTHKYGKVEIQTLEHQLTEAIRVCRRDKNMNEKSWGYETGVLITGHDAEYLLEVSKTFSLNTSNKDRT